jgi:L,D-transpeptidase ErfK/SrfK
MRSCRAGLADDVKEASSAVVSAAVHVLGAVALFAGMSLAVARAASGPPPVYDLVTGGEHSYTVAPGDSVWRITGRFTMSHAHFESLNPGLEPMSLRPGMRVVVSDRAIVPMRHGERLVIDVTGRALYWFEQGALKARFPIAVGRSSDQATPPGHYRIVGRRKDPIWHVPPSIQEEMRARGQEVAVAVPPGPDNPLGRYWIQLSAPGYGLHGTIAPASIGKYASHGCIRLLPEDIEHLYLEAPDGLPVEVVYEPVKLARDAEGRIYVEVHRDVYGRGRVDARAVLAAIGAAGLTDEIDPARVVWAADRAWGTAEDVTRRPDTLAER